MDKLGFVTLYFVLLPWSLIGVGAVLFMMSTTGFIVTGAESRKPIVGYATGMTVLALMQVSRATSVRASKC